MSHGKDSPELVRFMGLFQRLRDWIDDDPTGLELLAKGDDGVRRLCIELREAASPFLRPADGTIISPVDPKFILAWRDYETRYRSQIASVYWANSGIKLLSEDGFVDADLNSQIYAQGLDAVIEFAEMMAPDYEDKFSDEIQDVLNGVAAWPTLVDILGSDLEGALRREQLVPFVLIPRHVAGRYSHGERLSLLTHLKQAQDAFVLGVPLAALALMRAVLETTLKEHYLVEGKDLAELIDRCRSLPRPEMRAALHRLRQLANNVLHVSGRDAVWPHDLEKEMLFLLRVLRDLIEGAPASRR